jgi:short chain dehydrogenase
MMIASTYSMTEVLGGSQAPGRVPGSPRSPIQSWLACFRGRRACDGPDDPDHRATSGIGQAAARALAPRAGRLLLHGPEPRGPRAPTRTVTGDGNEQTLQVDYLAPVALTSLLLHRLAGQDRARIVNVASATHLSATLDLDDLGLRRGYSPVTAYAQAKLAVVTYTCWLAGHIPHPGVEAVSVHPGVIATGLLHAMFSIGGASPEGPGRTLVAVAGRSGDNGTYYDETRPADPNPLARDPAVQQRLLDVTRTRLAAAGIRVGPGTTGR